MCGLADSGRIKPLPVRRIQQRAHDLTGIASSLSFEEIRKHAPARAMDLVELPQMVWRQHWRGVLGNALESGQVNFGEEAILDWGLQLASVRAGPGVPEPSPESLPWKWIRSEFYRLVESAPYLLLIGLLQAPVAVASHGPRRLWDDLWLWQAPVVYPPTDPWAGVDHGFMRSPYSALVNAERGYPVHLEGLSRGANLFLTCRVPLEEESGELRADGTVWERAIDDMALGLACLRLSFDGCIALSSVVGIPEPFLGYGPILHWQTGASASSGGGTFDEPFLIVNEQLEEVSAWRARLRKLDWLCVPRPPFIRATRVERLDVSSPTLEVYSPSNALTYAFALWDLCHGRSATEMILNGWSLCEALFQGGASKTGACPPTEGGTSQVKRRVGAVTGRRDEIEYLSDLRQSFGHGRPHQGRRLDGSEGPRVRHLVRDVMRAVIQMTAESDDVDEESFRCWLCDMADTIAPRTR